MAKVSASMIIRNEEARLGDALGSLRRLQAIDEIVIVDTGSTDRSVELARDLGARVVLQPWQHDFAFHRNHCLSLCRNSWVFILDGDEILEDPGDLDAFFQAPDAQGALLRVTADARAHISETFFNIRAFDRRFGRWKYPVHNQIVGLGGCVLTSARVRAFYDPGDRASTERRLEILLSHQPQEPEDPHYPFFIAKMYRALRDFEAVETWARRFLALPQRSGMEPTVIAWRVEACLELSRPQEAMALLEEGLRRFPTYPDLCFYDFMLSAKRWYEAAAASPLQWLCAPSVSLGLAERFPRFAQEMGLPVEFADSPATEPAH